MQKETIIEVLFTVVILIGERYMNVNIIKTTLQFLSYITCTDNKLNILIN